MGRGRSHLYLRVYHIHKSCPQDFVIGSLKALYVPPREIISKHPVKDEEGVKVGVVEKLGDIFKKFIP